VSEQSLPVPTQHSLGHLQVMALGLGLGLGPSRVHEQRFL